MDDDLERNDKEVPLIDQDESRFDEESDKELYTSNGYRDVFFLILFLLNLLVLGAIAISYGGVSLFNSGAEYWVVRSNGTEYLDHSYDYMPWKLLTGLLFVIMASTILSVGWIYLLSHVATLFMNFIIMFITSGTALAGLIVLFMGYPTFAFLLVFLALGMMVISYLFQNRLEFASINLQIACKAILAIPSTFNYSFYMLVIQSLYIIVWSAAAIGYATNSYNIIRSYQGKEYNLDQCASYRYSSDFEVNGISLTCPSGQCYSCICEGTLVSSTSTCFTPKIYYSTMFFLILSLFWANNIISNVVHCTTSAAVYSWWTNGTCSDEEMKSHFDTITTKSLGSICFGSLLTAIVRTIRSFLHLVSGRYKRPDNNNRSILGELNKISYHILVSLTKALDRLILYFNRYAFCFVAIYGLGYLEAAKAAVDLFKSRGLTTLFNDDMIDLVIIVSQIIIAVICLVVGYVYAKVSGISGAYIYLVEVCSFSIGYVMSSVILSIIQSAVTTVYIGFAKNPSDFEIVHPLLYAPLANAWVKIFPGCLNLSATTKNMHSDESNDSQKTMESGFLSTPFGMNNHQYKSAEVPNKKSGTTVRGSYNPPDYQESTIPKPSLYSSMMQMVNNNNPRNGYEQVSTNEEVAEEEENENSLSHSAFNWGSNSAVASITKAMKDLARDPFGMGANSPTAAPSSMASNNPPPPPHPFPSRANSNRINPMNPPPPTTTTMSNNMYQMRNFPTKVNASALMSPQESV